jgi:flagellar export protein FliJ
MGKKFIFELETVLEHRRRLERDKQLALGALQGQRLALEQKIRDVQAGLSAGRAEVRTILAPGASVGTGGGRAVAIDQVRLAAHASLHQVAMLQRLGLELAGLHQKMQVARRELLAAVIARKGVETLRARRLEAWRREQSRLEANELDEINTQRAGLPAGDLA